MRRCGPGQVLEKGGAHLAAVPFRLQKLADNSVPLLLSFYPLLGLLADLLAFLIPDVGEGIPNLPAALLALGELIPQPCPVLPHGLHVMELVYGLSIPLGQAANGPVIEPVSNSALLLIPLFLVVVPGPHLDATRRSGRRHHAAVHHALLGRVYQLMGCHARIKATRAEVDVRAAGESSCAHGAGPCRRGVVSVETYPRKISTHPPAHGGLDSLWRPAGDRGGQPVSLLLSLGDLFLTAGREYRQMRQNPLLQIWAGGSSGLLPGA